MIIAAAKASYCDEVGGFDDAELILIDTSKIEDKKLKKKLTSVINKSDDEYPMVSVDFDDDELIIAATVKPPQKVTKMMYINVM